MNGQRGVVSDEDRREVDLLLQLWATRPASQASDAPGVLLGRFDDDELFVAFAPAQQREEDHEDPVAELGVLISAAVAEQDLRRITMLTPVRIRDLEDDQVIRRGVVATWLGRPATDQHADGIASTAWQMGASMTEYVWASEDEFLVNPVSEVMSIDSSPVASMLWDSLVTTAPGKLGDTFEALRVLGFEITPSQPDRWPTGTSSQADRTRHRTRSLATELHRRHRPMALADDPTARRLQVPVDLPDGFVPACPI